MGGRPTGKPRLKNKAKTDPDRRYTRSSQKKRQTEMSNRGKGDEELGGSRPATVMFWGVFG